MLCVATHAIGTDACDMLWVKLPQDVSVDAFIVRS